MTLFEKQDIPGGSMSMTYSGVASAGSKLQETYSQGRFDDNPNYNKDAMMAVLSKYVNPEFDRFDGAMPYDHAMYDTSGALVDWMHGIGVGFYSMGVNKAYGITPYLAPGCYEGGCGQAMQYLADRIGALGGTIVYGAKVTDIVMDGERAAGLVAEGKDGSVYTADAKAVLLAARSTAAPPPPATASCSARRSARASSAWAASWAPTCPPPRRRVRAWRSHSCTRPRRASW